MLIDEEGEKWACNACVRGHRVSNCHHADRPLQHINKKGRPVSQCPHCRGLRKSRSAHSKCECGEKAHTKANCAQDASAPESTCCCSHGARCTCALKKEPLLGSVPETEAAAPPPPPAIPMPPKILGRPRAATTQSDGSVTRLPNGHHKPIHKHNTMAHTSGMPYVVPRAHSLHGSAASSQTNRASESLPQRALPRITPLDVHIQDRPTSLPQEPRQVKSEHASPTMMGHPPLDAPSSIPPPLDLLSLEVPYTFARNMDGAHAADREGPLFSAGPSTASIDWSLYDGLDFNNDNFACSQPPSWLDFNSIDQPGLTSASTSGDLSEIEDLAALPTDLAHGPAAPQGAVPPPEALPEKGFEELDDIDRFLRENETSVRECGLDTATAHAMRGLDAVDGTVGAPMGHASWMDDYLPPSELLMPSQAGGEWIS